MRHRDAPLGSLLPGLGPWRSSPIQQASLRQRHYNALVRSGRTTWGDVAELTPAQISHLRGAGEITVMEIVAQCVRQSLAARPDGEEAREDSNIASHSDTETEPTTNALALLRAAEQSLATRPDGEEVHEDSNIASQSDTETESTARVLAALRAFAAWGLREREATQLAGIWQVNPGVGPVPPELEQLWDEFGQVELQQLADSKLLTVTLDGLADRLFKSMAERQRTVYQRRVLENKTLAEVGKELGVSRERIRQLQQKTERRIEGFLRHGDFRLLRWRAADLRSALGTMAPATHDITRLALERSLRGASPSAATLLGPLILRLAGPYRERDCWLTLEQADLPDASVVETMADEFGQLSLAEACEWLRGYGVRAEFHDAWLVQSGRFRRDGDRLMVWSGHVVDKCVALLASRNEPADAETLVALIGEGHNAKGVRGRLFEDKRLMRVNRTEWALAAWGLEEYTGITDEIAQRIDEAGGQIELNAVVKEIVRQFGVQENSVLAYTAAPMFVIEGDRIRMRRANEPIEVGGTLESCAGAFRCSERSISLLVPADAELLRGSGRPLSGPVAAALGVSLADRARSCMRLGRSALRGR